MLFFCIKFTKIKVMDLSVKEQLDLFEKYKHEYYVLQKSANADTSYYQRRKKGLTVGRRTVDMSRCSIKPKEVTHYFQLYTRQDQLFDLIRENPKISNEDISKILGIGKRSVDSLLNHMYKRYAKIGIKIVWQKD